MLAQVARAGVRRHLARASATRTRSFAQAAELVVDTTDKDFETESHRTVSARSLSLDSSSRFRVVDPAPEGFKPAVLKLLGYYGKQSRLIRGANTLYSKFLLKWTSLSSMQRGEMVELWVSPWMKELENNFYGAVASYDKAMRPEAALDELARALWRNVVAEDDSIMPTGSNSTPVHALARHVPKEAACLALTGSESFLTGNILFSNNFGVTE